MAVGSMAISPDDQLLAYSTDNTGFRQYTLHIRDLRRARTCPTPRCASARSPGPPTPRRCSTPPRMRSPSATTTSSATRWAHPSSEDVVVYEEKDERFNLGVGKTRDGKYLLMEVGSHTTTECWFLSAETPAGEFQLIAPRIDDQEYYPDHRDGLFFIRTNDAGKNFRVVTAPVAISRTRELAGAARARPRGSARRLRSLQHVLRHLEARAGPAGHRRAARSRERANWAQRSASPSPSRPTRREPTSTASSRQPPSATPISR